MALMPYVEGLQYETSSEYRPDWWSRLVHEVAETMDFIVWLNADEATLLRRVRNREKDHSIKHLTDQQALRYLGDQRQKYARLLKIIESVQGPEVLVWTESQGGIDARARHLRVVADGSFGEGSHSLATAIAS